MAKKMSYDEEQSREIDAFADRDEDSPPRPRGPEHSDSSAMHRIGSWTPSKAVDAVMCNQRRQNGMRCSNLVGATREAIDALDVFNRRLRSRGETTCQLEECLTCAECSLVRNRIAEERSEARRERTRTAIQQLKGVVVSSDEDRRQAMAWLEKIHGSGYLNDLLEKIRERVPTRRGRVGDL